MVTEASLRERVTAAATRLEVPGAAVAVLHDGEEHYAFHGVTSLENPLPVDERTLFQIGSTAKTHTATTVMRLVEQGRVDLDAPVRTYVPELVLKDESVAAAVTVRHLLNHTAGWSGDLMDDTGEGDDAIARYVANMANLEQVTPLGAVVSYNNASLALAGRVIERVTGLTYEQAVKDLLLEPLGLRESFFRPNEVMTRRFVVGHRQEPDGSIVVARPWALPRGGSPAGGIVATARDQLAWARFHLSGGRGADGTQVLSPETVALMQQPTATMAGSALGDAVGISWLLRDVGAVRLVEHGGDVIGQHSAFVLVPERNFAFVALTNCTPTGPQLQREIERWALESYLGIIEEEPQPVDRDAAGLAPYTGRYETIAAVCTVSIDGGGLALHIELKPEVAKALREAGDEVPAESQTLALGLLPGGDRYVVSDGPAKGMKGYFSRDAAGSIDGVHAGGRLAMRV